MVALSHYPTGAGQARHQHDHLQVSFLLAGEMRETIGRRDHEMIAPSMCVKPAGTDHADRWGRNGALLLSLRMRHPDVDAFRGRVCGAWHRTDPAPIAALVRAALATDHPAPLDAVVDDLLAVTDTESPPVRSAPLWLVRVREAIAEGAPLSADQAAALAGVHRVHLSRSFVHHFGLPLSVYRRRVMIGRAVEAALRTEDALAEVAQHAGFADQSHMHRAIAEAFGVTPRHLRRAFAERVRPDWPA